MTNWRNLFEKRILERGYNYFKDNCVVNLDNIDNHYEAVVLGSDCYDVSLDFQDNKATNLECNCPYAKKDNNCKHMAALLYEIDSDNDSYIKNTQEDNYEIFRKEYDFIEKEELMKFIFKAINKNTESYDDFMNTFAYKK